MIVIEQPAPIRERALSGPGAAVLKAVAETQAGLGAATISAVKRRAKTSEHEAHMALLALDAARLIVFDSGFGNYMRATMTDAGWAIVGGKPLWMAA